MEWQNLFYKELSSAQEARVHGNEGKARVCARRAAGILIGEYLARKGVPDPGVSTIDRLRVLENLPGVSIRIKQAAQHLQIHVTPEHVLPVEVDLLAEVQWLRQELRLEQEN